LAWEDVDMAIDHPDGRSSGIGRFHNDDAVRISNWTLATGRPPVRRRAA
jgi:hypothetical protein